MSRTVDCSGLEKTNRSTRPLNKIYSGCNYFDPRLQFQFYSQKQGKSTYVMMVLSTEEVTVFSTYFSTCEWWYSYGNL